jgi:hypothetical protein
MSSAEVSHYNGAMLFFSFVFLAAAWLFTGLFGSVGFVMANSINMMVRIVYR